MNQRHYVLSLLKDCGMIGGKLSTIPIDLSLNLLLQNRIPS